MHRIKTNNLHVLDSRHKKTYYPINESALKNNQVENLKQTNAELVKKEELYIQRLMKLQQGLQRQHISFMTLQELYDQLLEGYRRKQQEINNLQLLYRQTQRKRNESINVEHHRQLEQTHKFLQIQSKYDKLYEEHRKLIQLHQNLKIQNSKNISEISYLRNKQKMNDSRTNLQSRVLEQLNEWQKQVDQGKQEKIKLLYENNFLKERNKDLQQIRKQLEKVIQSKQKQIFKLRQQKIAIIRQTSKSRISRSASPNHSATSRDDRRTNNKLLDTLRKQNQSLENSIKHMKQHHQTQQIHLDHENLHHQFFSFSRDDKSEKENCQSNSYENNSGIMIKEEYSNSVFQDLPNFPAQLQIETIIGNKQNM